MNENRPEFQQSEMFLETFDTNKEIIDSYANNSQYTAEEKVEYLLDFRKSIEEWCLHTSTSNAVKQMQIEKIKSDELNRFIEEFDPETSTFDLEEIGVLIEDEDWFDTNIIGANMDYWSLIKELNTDTLDIKSAIESKYYLDQVLKALTTNSSLPVYKKKEINPTEFNQFQTTYLFNALRDKKMISNSVNNRLLSQTIEMLTGYSNAQTVKVFSKFNDKEEVNKQKEKLIVLLESILKDLKK